MLNSWSVLINLIFSISFGLQLLPFERLEHLILVLLDTTASLLRCLGRRMKDSRPTTSWRRLIVPSNEFPSISAAVRRVESGDIICLTNPRYEECVSFLNSPARCNYFVIEGHSPQHKPTLTCEDEPVFSVSCIKHRVIVVLRNLVLLASTTSCLHVSYNCQAFVQNCEFVSTAACVEVRDYSYLRVEDCRFTCSGDCPASLRLLDSCCEVSCCEFDGSGIALLDSNCGIFKSTFKTLYSCAINSLNSFIHMMMCTVLGNSDGVVLASSTGVLTHNTFTNNAGIGLLVHGTSSVSLGSSVFTENGFSATCVHDGSELVDLGGNRKFNNDRFRPTRRQHFLRFALTRHARVGADSHAHRLVEDILFEVYQHLLRPSPDSDTDDI